MEKREKYNEINNPPIVAGPYLICAGCNKSWPSDQNTWVLKHFKKCPNKAIHDKWISDILKTSVPPKNVLPVCDKDKRIQELTETINTLKRILNAIT